jgi:hypothetical protein
MCSGALRDILEHVRKVCSEETAKSHVKNKDDSLHMTQVQETNVQSNIGWIYCGHYLQPPSGGLMKSVGSSHGSL